MSNDDLRPEYDFSKLGKPVRGKYAEAYKQGSNVAKVFNAKAVNDALRLLMKLAKQQAVKDH